MTVLQRLRRVMGYFTRPRLAWWVLALSVRASAGSALEPTIPALLKPLLDDGIQIRRPWICGSFRWR